MIINPLVRLKMNGITYERMAELTGLHILTIYNLRDITTLKELYDLKVETLVKVYDGLGVNFFEFIIKHK